MCKLFLLIPISSLLLVSSDGRICSCGCPQRQKCHQNDVDLNVFFETPEYFETELSGSAVRTMIGSGTGAEAWELVNADGSTQTEEQDTWILLGRRDKKVPAFVDDADCAQAQSRTAKPLKRAETPGEETAAEIRPERLRSEVAALAALCGRPRAAVAPRGSGRAKPSPAKKKSSRRARKLAPFNGRPTRMRQLYP